MNVNYFSKGIDSSEAVKELLGKKVKKLERRLKNFKNVTIDVIFTRGEGLKKHKMKVNVKAGKYNFYSSVEHKEMYKALDICIEKVERQVEKAKKNYYTDSRNIKSAYKFKQALNPTFKIDDKENLEDDDYLYSEC